MYATYHSHVPHCADYTTNDKGPKTLAKYDYWEIYLLSINGHQTPFCVSLHDGLSVVTWCIVCRRMTSRVPPYDVLCVKDVTCYTLKFYSPCVVYTLSWNVL